MKFDVVCFGSAVVDAFVETDTKEANKSLVISYDSKQLMKGLSFYIGGGGTNVAVAFSRLGLKTGYIGEVGNDSNGKKILDLLKKENVAFLGKKAKGKTSGFSVILINKNKQHRSVLTYKGINDKISERDVKKFDAKWLYLSSMMKKSFQTQLKLARKCKKNGVKIAYNPSEYLIKKVNVKPLLSLCDVVIMNKEEAGLLTKSGDKLKSIYNMGPKIVVITDDKKIVKCYDGKKIYSINPPNVKVVDKTGAGDAFAAGFVSGLIKEKPIEFCLKLGIKEATSEIKYIGVKNNLLKMKLK